MTTPAAMWEFLSPKAARRFVTCALVQQPKDAYSHHTYILTYTLVPIHQSHQEFSIRSMGVEV